jgi:hypothetical protein
MDGTSRKIDSKKIKDDSKRLFGDENTEEKHKIRQRSLR